MRDLKQNIVKKLKNKISDYYSKKQDIYIAYEKQIEFRNRITELESEVIMTVSRNTDFVQYNQELKFNYDLTLDLMETLDKAYKEFCKIMNVEN